MPWDPASLEALTKRYNAKAAKIANFNGMMGPRGQVNEETRHIAAAAGWGLFPEKDATYLNYNGKHDYRRCFKATYPVPENKAFWSITVYGEDGYMKHENNILNSNNVKLNPDGTFTASRFTRSVWGRSEPARRGQRLELRDANLPARPLGHRWKLQTAARR